MTALSNSARRIALLLSLLAFAVFHVLVGLVQFGSGENFTLIPSVDYVSGIQRASGLYVNPNHLAGLLEVLGIFALSITCWSRWPRWSRVIVGYLAAMCYIGVAMTGSRGGYLGVAVSLIIFGLLSLIVLRSAGTAFLLKWVAAGLIALVAVGLLVQQSAPVTERIANLVTPDKTRLDLWRASIEQWKLQPLIGTGSGTYLFYGRQFRAERVQEDPVYVHNDYLHLLCEYGVVGFVGYLLFFSAHLRRGWRTFLRLGPNRFAAGSPPLSDRLALNIGALCATAAYIVHSAVDYNLHIPANALLLAFVFGVLAHPGLKANSEIALLPVSLVPRLATVVLAVILLFQSARLFPGEYYAERARLALEDGDPTKAISFAKEALLHERQNPTIYFYLGRASIARAYEKGRTEAPTSFFEEALAAFGEGHRLAPLDETYPVDLAFTYDAMGRFAEAEWMYGVARSRDPRSLTISQLYRAHLESWASLAHKPALAVSGAPVKHRETRSTLQSRFAL